MPDIVPGNATTTASLVLESGTFGTGSVSGRLDTYGEQDWFKITLAAGETYRFYSHVQVSGISYGGYSSLALYDKFGNVIRSVDFALNPHFTYTATSTETLFLGVYSRDHDGRGEYTIVASTETPTDVFHFAGEQTLTANAGERIMAGWGDDYVTMGAAGRDAFGEQGNDTLVGNALANIFSGGLGADQLLGAEGNDLLLGDAGDDWLRGGPGNDRMYGGNGFDRLDGEDGRDILNGGADGDYMAGGGDDDTYYVDSVDDIVYEAQGGGINDLVISNINYVLPSEVNDLRLVGSARNGTGNQGTNHIIGNSLANILDGRQGADTLEGGAGNDTYIIDRTSDVLIDTSGIDTVRSSVSTTLKTGFEKLVLLGSANLNGNGNSANNVLTGNSGNNKLKGASGNDTLSGGKGHDTMDGGSGRDTYDFNDKGESRVGATHDVISTFSRGSDKIDLKGIDAKTGVSGNQAFKWIGTATFHHVKGELHFKDLGAQVLVSGDVNGDAKADFEILVKVGTLGASDFLL